MRKDFNELKDYVQREGEVCFGFEHPLYGILPDLYFIFETKSVNKIVDFFEDPEQHGEFVTRIWKSTLTATQPRILQMSHFKNSEMKIARFSDFREALKHIDKILKKNPSMEQDPFYYRKGNTDLK